MGLPDRWLGIAGIITFANGKREDKTNASTNAHSNGDVLQRDANCCADSCAYQESK